MNITQMALTIVFALAGPSLSGPGDRQDGMKNMLYIEGGAFEMGDVFHENVRWAVPIHDITVNGFHLNKHEVTVTKFAAFVGATEYVTSAEGGAALKGESRSDSPGQQSHLASRGSWVLTRTNASWASDASWRNVHFEQTGTHPVTCVSWTDAVSYCNWLSIKDGLPAAYHVKTGNMLDADGKPTTDVKTVKGYRLPTEAEWEYAARERGRKIRFGNGKNIARSTEMNIDTTGGEYAYVERGEYCGKTKPVGSFRPNSLGLCDMGGNVWEWCSDIVGPYSDQPQTNPYQTQGIMGPRRAARGGRWSGDAGEARTATRLGWTMEDRCNNIGFRLARSK